eukprot:2854329-Rhodomonas_salina.1
MEASGRERTGAIDGGKGQALFGFPNSCLGIAYAAALTALTLTLEFRQIVMQSTGRSRNGKRQCFISSSSSDSGQRDTRQVP